MSTVDTVRTPAPTTMALRLELLRQHEEEQNERLRALLARDTQEAS